MKQRFSVNRFDFFFFVNQRRINNRKLKTFTEQLRVYLPLLDVMKI